MSAVHKHKAFIFNCKQDEEPHVHIVEVMVSLLKRSLMHQVRCTWLLLSIAIVCLVDEYFCLELGKFDCLELLSLLHSFPTGVFVVLLCKLI